MTIMKELEKNYIMKGVRKPQYYASIDGDVKTTVLSIGGDVVELQELWSKKCMFTSVSSKTQYIKNCLPKLYPLCVDFPSSRNKMFFFSIILPGRLQHKREEDSTVRRISSADNQTSDIRQLFNF